MLRSAKALAAVLLLVLVLGLAGCGSSAPPQTTSPGGTAPAASGGAGATIVEKGFAFTPATLDVKTGDTVTFKNEDSTAHEVSIGGKDLGSQAPGASVTWTADKAGAFPYSCVIHPSMTGQITVK